MSMETESLYKIEKDPGSAERSTDNFKIIDELPDSVSKNKIKDLFLRVKRVQKLEESPEKKFQRVGWFSGLSYFVDYIKEHPAADITTLEMYKDLNTKLTLEEERNVRKQLKI